MNKKDKDEQIALFRYGIISSVFYKGEDSQIDYFKRISKKVHDVPYLGKKRYKVGTYKSWLRKYRKGGFKAIKPKTRSDKGASRKINEALGAVIKETIEELPSLSDSGIYRILSSKKEMMSIDIHEGTLRKYIRDNNLRVCKTQTTARKKFEKENANELWISDSMYGPYMMDGNKSRRTYLISIIDDCTRVITAAKFFFHENSINLEIILKEAISRFGLPKIFYCDNGSIFISTPLQLACARLGIALVHSKPYDSPSRGKIERYHRTIRQKFLPLIEHTKVDSIEVLNASFSSWLDKDYHKYFHTGIGAKPLDKWMDNIKHINIKRISKEELDLACYMAINRKVKNDSTVSINGSLYEVAPKFIGEKIEIRYPIDSPEELHLFEDDKPVYQLKKVNPIENANLPTLGIKFNKKEE